MNRLINSICLFLLVIAGSTGFAQKINWSETLEIPKNTYIRQIVGEDDQQRLYVLRGQAGDAADRSNLWIERHQSDMSLEYSKRLNIPLERNIPHEYERILWVDGRLILFTTYFHKGSRRHMAYATPVGETGELQGLPAPLDTIMVEKLGNLGSFDFRLSQDGNQVLIYRYEPQLKYSDEQFHLRVIESDLKTRWSQIIKPGYKDRQFDPESVKLDRAGNVHLLARINHTDQETPKDQANFHYILLSYNPSANDLREFEIRLPKRAVTDITFKIDDEGDILTAGFFSNQARSESHVGGSFFLRINPATGQVTGKGMKDFEKSFITEFIGEKKADKGKELYNYAIDHFISKEDGGFMMIGEQVVKTVTCHPDPRTGFEVCNDNYYYNDIIVVNYSSEGSIQWARRVPKRQLSINDNGFYSSYLKSFKDNQLHLVFNENPFNFNSEDGERPKTMTNLKKSTVALVSIDNEGKLQKKPLFSNKEENITLRPKVHKVQENSDVIIFGQRRKYYQLGRLSFN